MFHTNTKNLAPPPCLESGLGELGFGELEYAGEVQRLHGGLLALLGEVVGAQHVQVEGQHGDENTCAKGLQVSS